MSLKISELPVLAPEDVAAGDVVAIVDSSEGVTKQVDLSGVLAGGGSGDPFETKAIAEPFPVWDHITGAQIPDNSGTAKFIRLTAGQSGFGEYNEGLLIDEQATGSGALFQVSAEIAVGPLAGNRVWLVNNMGAFIRAGTASGTFRPDQMQGHRHEIQNAAANPVASSGFVGDGGAILPGFRGTSVSNDFARTIRADATNGTPRIGDRTYPAHVDGTYYMRIE